ncbi:MAG: TIGR02679 domain-containing protein [Huintestinicola sp.]|uniref:TIGR02679 domain-containing protein n=1 Tax=Huintestinicola sp. TaxID=2981661 RepID=UPI003F07D435
MTDVQECVGYFKARPSYDRIMKELLRIYKSYGALKGNIVLSDASAEECEAANAVVTPKRAFSPPVLKFSAVSFEKGLEKTRFRGVPLRAVVELYFGESIVKNSEKKIISAQNKEAFLTGIADENKDMPCYEWIKSVRDQKKFGYRSIISEYSSSEEEAWQILKNVCAAINKCSEGERAEPVQLAVLSASITGDSHYFDQSNFAGRLLIKGLAYIAGIDEANNGEARKIIYGLFGIEPDNISGAVAAVGIRLYDHDKSEHMGYKVFADSGEICLISSANLSGIGYADSDSGRVYVVENQMVFSALSSTAAAHKLSLLCTSGQMKSAGIKLIDMLVRSGCEILYAGDFDPEGLQIADKLLRRYDNKNVHTWRMSREDYASISKAEDISESRLKKLRTICSNELREIADELGASGKAAYQELLLPAMKKDMLGFGESVMQV